MTLIIILIIIACVLSLATCILLLLYKEDVSMFISIVNACVLLIAMICLFELNTRIVYSDNEIKVEQSDSTGNRQEIVPVLYPIIIPIH